jgi:hypothetical protein
MTHIFILSWTSPYFKMGLLFKERRGVTTTGHAHQTPLFPTLIYILDEQPLLSAMPIILNLALLVVSAIVAKTSSDNLRFNQ